VSAGRPFRHDELEYGSSKEEPMRTLRVRDVMTTRVVAVTPATPFREVADLMLRHEIGAVPVIDDAGALTGLISEADLISKQAYGGFRLRMLRGVPGVEARAAGGMLRSRGRQAREVMSAPVETVMASDPVRVVARRMVEHRLRHLVVVDGEHRMVGIVSRRDLLRAFDRTDAEIGADVRSELEHGHPAAPVDVAVTVDDGVVTLDGRVHDLRDVPAVCRLAWGVPGVVDVIDHLTTDAGADRASTS
jgi:CBS domain-containing protein